jgi:hypothetical protein
MALRSAAAKSRAAATKARSMRTPRRLISASRSCRRRSNSLGCRSLGLFHTARAAATSVMQRACTNASLSGSSSQSSPFLRGRETSRSAFAAFASLR